MTSWKDLGTCIRRDDPLWQEHLDSDIDAGHRCEEFESLKGVIESAKSVKRSDPKSITEAIPWYIFFPNIVNGYLNTERTASLDDWIRVYHNTKNKNAYWFRQNLGGGKFDQSVQFNVDMNCDLDHWYALADFLGQNSDGLDDFFCIKENAVWLSLNRGGKPLHVRITLEAMEEQIFVESSYGKIACVHPEAKEPGLAVIGALDRGWGDKSQWQGFSTAQGIRGTVFSTVQPEKPGITLGMTYLKFRLLRRIGSVMSDG
ncbi:uncharacterized protein FFFS_14687 [Fusarium fujikuroi]|nr:uncharacterized protein FFFS_14687 [Fusarium fujikuroi]